MVLDNVVERMTRDLLSMLVENVSGLDEGNYSLEVIQESSRAVITFNSPAGKRGQETPVNRQSHAPTVKTCRSKLEKTRSSTVHCDTNGVWFQGSDWASWWASEMYVQGYRRKEFLVQHEDRDM